MDIPPIELLIICATDENVGKVERWIESRYPGEYLSLPIELAGIYFWALDQFLAPQDDVIKSLGQSRIVAFARNVAGVKAVYVPPQSIARQKCARGN